MKTFNLVVRTSKYKEIMNNFKVLTALAAFCACGALAAPAGQLQQQQQPVPILKQVNRQNEDGSYSYGYENADGSFKIETKYPTGEVYGKYGYVDETGKLRTVEYGASSARGFEPAGAGITVPPPAWSVESNDLHGDARRPLSAVAAASPQSAAAAASSQQQQQDDYDDGQYREDPSVYYKADLLQQQQQLQQQLAEARQSSPPMGRQQHVQWTGGQKAAAKFQDSGRHFQAHPSVHDFDPLTGSFSISYTG